MVLAQDEALIRQRRDRRDTRDAIYVEVLCWNSHDGRDHRDRMLDMAQALNVHSGGHQCGAVCLGKKP